VGAWYGLTASRRGEAVLMYVLTVAFAGVTLVALAGGSGLDPARDEGGVARSVAVGVLFVAAGLLGARYRPQRAATRSR
jgi:hypothetical protein